MGFAMSYVAVKDKTASEILKTLSLTTTPEQEEIPESPHVGAALKNGWYLVVANSVESALFTPEALKRLSAGCELVMCTVEEHVMYSYAAGYTDGQQVWEIDHEGDKGDLQNLKQKGELPTSFAEIETRLRAQQSESDGTVDYIFDAPVQLVQALTGFRYDGDIDGMFTVLKLNEQTRQHSSKPESQAKSRPWWKPW